MPTERAMRGAEVINDSMFSNTADEDRMAVIIDRETSLPALEAVAVAAKNSLLLAAAIKSLTSRSDIPDVWDGICEIEASLRAALARLEKGSPDA